MTRSLLLLLALKILLIPGCERRHNAELNTSNQANVYLKGTLLHLSYEEINSIIKQTDNTLAEGEDRHTIKVTSDLINKIKENEQFLEISFKNNRFVMTDKYGKIEFRKVMIPLSGQYAQPGSFTVFYGTSGYTDSPMICSNGYKELQELLIGMEY
jgi:hypothetical protein